MLSKLQIKLSAPLKRKVWKNDMGKTYKNKSTENAIIQKMHSPPILWA